LSTFFAIKMSTIILVILSYIITLIFMILYYINQNILLFVISTIFGILYVDILLQPRIYVLIM